MTYSAKAHLTTWLSLLALLLGCLPQPSFAQMTAIDDFGPNPGNLNLYVHVPEQAAERPALVLALHGCVQDAATYARETGWNELADQAGFIVAYPEQQQTNNPQNCFSWFNEDDINREVGEAKSIKSMVDHLLSRYPIDPTQVFVTGLSAGGCMTAVMLATYPDVFEAGAVMAGVPYKATTDLAGAVPAMRGEIDQSPEDWSALVAEQHPDFDGGYPRMVIFHGAKDEIVNPQNMDELVEQWTHLHGLSNAPAEKTPNFDEHPDVTRLAYRDPQGRAQVLAYEVANMGHALAVNPGDGPKEGGSTGKFAVDVDFHYTYWAARFFGLVD